MATVSIELRSDRTDPNSWAPVRLRIAHRGTKRYISLGFKVLASKWNSDREEVTRSHPDQKEYNDDLSEIKSTAQSALRSENRARHVVTARRLEEEIQKRLGPPEEVGYDFLSFAEERLKEYRPREQISMFESYRLDPRKFRQFVEDEYGVEELPCDAIDVELVESFRTFCYEVRENSTNTVGKALETLRVFVNKALAEGKARSYPFKYIQIDSEPVQKDLLDPKEIDQIADLDLNEESFLAEVRRWFLFSYYTGGMRFSDVAMLQWKHIRPGPSGYTRVYWKMQKTSDNVGVPLSDDAQQILRLLNSGSGRVFGREHHLFGGEGTPVPVRVVLWRMWSREAGSPFLVLATWKADPGEATELYRRCSEIELIFAALKSRGFDLESTNLTDPSRAERPVSLLALAFS